MLKHASERCKEQKTMGVKSRSGSIFKGKEMTSQNGRAPSSDLELIPDLVNAKTTVTESNYNSINYHMKMSDRNRTVIRRRAERLRQRDMEIRKRLEKVNKKAKPIGDGTSAKQDIKSCQEASLTSKTDTESEKSIKQPTLCTVIVSSNEIAVNSSGSMDLLQHETGSMRMDYQMNNNICDSVSSLNSLTSQPETGSVENGSQCNLNETTGTVSEDQETGSEVQENQLNHKKAWDAVSADDDMATEIRRGREGRSAPAEHMMKMHVTSTTDEENIERKSPTTKITNEHVENESARSPAVKLKAFVGERYCFNKAKILSKSTNGISKEENVHTPKRKKQTMCFYLADMASPHSLGISPKRIKLHKSSKKTRIASTLTSSFTGSMNFSKMKMRKTVLNILKTDRRACSREVF
ncbi:hypothetical protein KP79_PYT17165 [Mizuhopecten yessoensis]|uniref:Uncharacterized protein n=1 Tax=Mizuhopecten yessoensis TaxID=6573 RepID=A0A210QHM3_MIZYE|nr:hypothetical protein KP79_PYT17165 [Mizuhopecten yessoensis]